MNIKRYHIGEDLGATIQPKGQPIESPDGWWCAADEVEKEISRLQGENERLKQDNAQLVAKFDISEKERLRIAIERSVIFNQLRTAEQRVARECLETFEDLRYELPDFIIDEFKAKYGL